MADPERYQHYEVLRREDGNLWELGRGAMGITYKAFDTNLRCSVALKVINNSYLNSEVARQRFLREARAAASLRHRNVASVFHLGTDRESYFYAMEFIDGETVEAYIKRKGLLNPAEALGITLQVSRALAAADKENLVHRDLKPSNLMLIEEDDEKVVKVIDFGLAKSTQGGGESSGTLTIGGGFVGTPHFASPEQLEESEIDIRSDIYSLGATLYYMLVGRPPYSGSVAQIMSQHLYKPIPLGPLDGFPPCVVDLIQRMMEKDPSKRPQRPGDLRSEILPCLGTIKDNVAAGSSPAATTSAGEQPDALATLDLSTIRPDAEESAALLAQRYRIISELENVPHGRRFLADDLARARQVSVLLFSPEFISDVKRYVALEQEIDRLHRSPDPSLCQIYSLEGVAPNRFLVQEHVVGPSLLEILRARSFLGPPETWLLLTLLAPVADHAQSNELQQVDITLSGVQLISPQLTEIWAESDILRQPLTRWDQLGVKVKAIDFSLSSSDPATWVGSATLTPAVSGDGGRPSYLRMLSLLVYELLGGPRNSLEGTGHYRPVASLSERGNALLRRGLCDDFRSATEMALQLGGEIGPGSIDPGTILPASVGAPSSSSVNLPSGTAIPRTHPAPPTQYAGQPTFAAPSTGEKRKHSAFRVVPILVLIAVVGLGGYLLYQLRLGMPSAKKQQPITSPANSLARASPVPSQEALASPSAEASATPNPAAPAGPVAEVRATPNQEALAGPSAEAGARPNPGAPAGPVAEVRATPNQEALASPSAEASATSDRAAPAGPVAEVRATPNQEALASPSAEASARPNPAAPAGPVAEVSTTPNQEALASPSAEASATPNPAAPAGPVAEVSATPNQEALAGPSAEAGARPNPAAPAGPVAEVRATPNQEALAGPSAEASARPNPGASAGPVAEVSASPNREALASPTAEPSAGPNPAASAGPVAEVSTAPHQEAPPSPGAEASATPNPAASAGPVAEVSASPNREALASPTAEPSATPNPGASAGPMAEARATPNQEALTGPSAEASATPNLAVTTGPSLEVRATPSREALARPSPEAGPMARLEPIARSSPTADDYPEKLAAARRLIDNTDWPDALKAYLALIEQYPERPAASRSLEIFLTDWSTNERKLDPESFTQMRPDLERAAEHGVLQAMLIMARYSQETDRAAALKWYEAAASKGSGEGMKKAGDLLYSNHKRPDDDAKALDYFVQAASTGDPEAEYLAGECYFFGKGTMPNIDKAVQFLQQAAARHYTKAMDLLGTCYRKQGNFGQARRSYEEAAAAGYALSFYNLGVLYINGEGVSRSPKKAEEQFKRCAELSKQNAEKGDMIAMFYYASWLEQGIGVAKDPSAASEWFRRSARAGYPPAIDWCQRNGVVP